MASTRNNTHTPTFNSTYSDKKKIVLTTHKPKARAARGERGFDKPPLASRIALALAGKWREYNTLVSVACAHKKVYAWARAFRGGKREAHSKRENIV